MQQVANNVYDVLSHCTGILKGLLLKCLHLKNHGNGVRNMQNSSSSAHEHAGIAFGKCGGAVLSAFCYYLKYLIRYRVDCDTE